MAPPLACTHEIYATRIAKRKGADVREDRKDEERGNEKSLEPLNSFNFAAAPARIIASDCTELTGHKTFETL